MLKTILVALDESVWGEAAVTLALDWAERFGARLLGLGIFDKASIVRLEPIPLGASSFKQHADAARLADAEKRVHHCLRNFRKRCLAAGVAAEEILDEGNPSDCILKNAHRCDVVMLGRETYFHFENQEHSDPTLGQILRRCCRPIIAVPRELPAATGVAVAYGAGREVARTLQTVQLLGLAAGETIHLVTVRSADQKFDVLASFAAEFLKSHGAGVETHLVQPTQDVAELLLDQVEKIKPRLLVMGAQGHHPLRDLFATSVTRAVLRTCPVPVLIGA